jgi:acetyltransferase-like isoleucine patch superfamily enzyme
MKIIKQLYWSLLQEAALFHIHYLNALTGESGISARKKYYRKMCSSCGNGLIVEENVRIQSPQNLQVGDNVWFSANSYLNASGGLKIGSDVYIGSCVKIWTDNHIFQDPEKPFTQQGFEYKPVTIQNDVWIGPRVFIKPGISVMTGSIINAGTVLAKNVPPFAILEGNPGRIVGWRKPRN